MPTARSNSLNNSFVLGLALSAMNATAQADQLLLKNGDNLSGTIISKRGNTLTFSTRYAGELKIDWDEVASLSSDKPIAVMLNDEQHLEVALKTTTKTPQPGMPALGDIAYINPNPEESGRGYRLSGKGNLAYTQSEGNSNSDQLHADVEFSIRARDYRLTAGAEMDEASIEGIKADDSQRAYASYDSFFAKKEFLFVHGQLQRDPFRDIALRTIGGGGYGYQLYDTETTRLSLKGGLDMVQLKRYVSPSESFAALGWHIDFEHKLAGSDIEIFHVQDGYRSLSSAASALVQTRSGFRFPLSSGFHALTQLNLDWESDPAPGRKKTDTKLMIGLGYSYD